MFVEATDDGVDLLRAGVISSLALKRNQGVKDVPADSAQMHEHRLLGRIGVRPEGLERSPRVRCNNRPAVRGEGTPHDSKPLFLTSDEPEHCMQGR